MDHHFESVSEDGHGGYLVVEKGRPVSVPNDPGNRHYQMVREWIADGKPVTPHVVSIDDLRVNAKALIRTHGDQLGARFTAGYPRHEIASWPAKFAEALAVEAGGTDAPLLAVEAQALGTDIATLAAKVVAKGSVFREAAALIAAMRQNAGAAIDAAQTEAEIDAAVAAAEADAETRFAPLMPA